jgi:hypothetical protein
VRLGEVRPERGELVPWADVVVDDVKEDGQAARVRGVHEPLQRVGPAVRLVHRPQPDPVVSPAVLAGVRRERHQLHRGHAKPRQVVQPLDGRIQRPRRSERAGVQLVDDRARERRAAPARI